MQGLQNSGRVFDQQQPSLDKFSGMQMETYGRVAPGAETGITGAQSLVNRNLSGANLTGNPYLQGIIDKTSRSVRDRVGDEFSSAGRYGPNAAMTETLTRSLAEAENGLRYQDYGTERGYQQDAVGQAQNLMGGSQSLLNNAAELPWIGVGALNGNVRQASSGYGTQTQTQSGGLASTLMGAAGLGLQGAAMFSEPSMKKNVKPLGQRQDGLGVYEYEYKPETGLPGGRQVGVMADEVENMRPDAMGPSFGGARTVDYTRLGLPAPGMSSGIVAGDQPPIDLGDFGGMGRSPGGPDYGALGESAKLPRIFKPGIAGAAERLVDPDLNSTSGKLGVLGQYLMAGADGTAFQDLGGALIGARGETEKRDIQRQKIRISQQEANALEAYRRAQLAASQARIERGNQPPSDVRTAEWYRTATPEQRRAYDATRPVITNGMGSMVVPRENIGGMGSASGGGIAPNTVEDGYMFLGGDPADPSNWKPLGGGR